MDGQWGQQGHNAGSTVAAMPLPGYSALPSAPHRLRPPVVETKANRMIQLFRKFFSSKIGIGVTLAFLGLIAFAFASSDIANTSMSGGLSGGSRIAAVGSQRIDATNVQTAANNALDQVRQNDPRITMPAFLAQGGLDEVIDQLVDRASLVEFGRIIGLRVSDRLIDSEILQIPGFRGVDGNFDRNAFLAVLSQRGITEAAVRDDLSATLMARQLATPVMLAPVLPSSLGSTYASLLRETRIGAIARIPSEAFVPAGNPTDAQVQAFYTANRESYIRPERRVIRFAAFGEEALKSVPEPTAAQIQARYQRDRTQYAATERRSFTQLVASTQAIAQEIATAVRGGTSLDAAARARGLATTQVAASTKAELTTNTSAAVADAGFAASQGAIANPARGPLGWFVLQVDGVQRQAERPLAQVRDEIATSLRAELRRAAFADMAANIEDQLDSGTSLTDMARELGLTVTSTAPTTGDGSIYLQPGASVPPAVQPVLQVAFDMDEGEPQLAETVPGQSFLIYDVSEITPSAPAPLAEIRDEVIAAWKLDRGAAAARQAADRVLARVAKGSTLAEAIAAEETTLPAPQPVRLGREELARIGQVPPPLALMFSMAAGSVKRLEERGDAGWFVIRLDTIEPGQVAADDALISATLQQLGNAAGDEYAAQFLSAVQRQVKVERNAEAIEALRRQLSGTAEN
jgi:peptidyl-prolyl cis-trans isomerase D